MWQIQLSCKFALGLLITHLYFLAGVRRYTPGAQVSEFTSMIGNIFLLRSTDSDVIPEPKLSGWNSFYVLTSACEICTLRDLRKFPSRLLEQLFMLL